MKKIYFLLFIAISTYVFSQSNCLNRDFEDGNFTNWMGDFGSNAGSSNLSLSPGFISNGNDALVNDPLARHTIITQNSLDSFCIDPATMQLDSFMTKLRPGGGKLFS